MPHYTIASKNEVRKIETLSETLYSSIEITWLTKQKQRLRFLFSKPRRRLCRLRLKFVQTTRVVCTDFSWSLQKVLCTYKFKCAYLLKCLRVLIIVSARTYDNEYDVLISRPFHNTALAEYKSNVPSSPELDTSFDLSLKRFTILQRGYSSSLKYNSTLQRYSHL